MKSSRIHSASRLPSTRAARRRERSLPSISSAMALVWRGLAPVAITKKSVQLTASPIARTTMSSAFLSAACPAMSRASSSAVVSSASSATAGPLARCASAWRRRPRSPRPCLAARQDLRLAVVESVGIGRRREVHVEYGQPLRDGLADAHAPAAVAHDDRVAAAETRRLARDLGHDVVGLGQEGELTLGHP